MERRPPINSTHGAIAAAGQGDPVLHHHRCARRRRGRVARTGDRSRRIARAVRTVISERPDLGLTLSISTSVRRDRRMPSSQRVGAEQEIAPRRAGSSAHGLIAWPQLTKWSRRGCRPSRRDLVPLGRTSAAPRSLDGMAVHCEEARLGARRGGDRGRWFRQRQGRPQGDGAHLRKDHEGHVFGKRDRDGGCGSYLPCRQRGHGLAGRRPGLRPGTTRSRSHVITSQQRVSPCRTRSRWRRAQAWSVSSPLIKAW